MSSLPAITLSSLDHLRLTNLIERVSVKDFPGVIALKAELDRAEVVEPRDMPADVISMNSRARIRLHNSGEEREITLCYPADADADSGRISILAPIGSALLGLAVGQQIDWPLPDGSHTRIEVLAVSYQPEADGDYLR